MRPEIPDFFKSRPGKYPYNRRKIARRRMILRVLAGVLPPILGGIYSKLEANWLDLSKISLPFKGIQKQEKLKLLHISDLHLSQAVSLENIEIALQKGFSESPDACFITGDFITDTLSEPKLQSLGKLLFKFSSKSPIYACLGNHDGGLWASKHGGPRTSEDLKRILKKSGVQLLVNESIKVRINGIPLQIAGVGDLWSQECHPNLCLRRYSNPLPSEPVVVMCHNPDAKEMLQPFYWNIMFAGHTHGGQFIIPFTKLAPFAPVLDHSMLEGLHCWDKSRYIHITRGVGNLYGLRFNCRPEINLIELVSQ